MAGHKLSRSMPRTTVTSPETNRLAAMAGTVRRSFRPARAPIARLTSAPAAGTVPEAPKTDTSCQKIGYGSPSRSRDQVRTADSAVIPQTTSAAGTASRAVSHAEGADDWVQESLAVLLSHSRATIGPATERTDDGGQRDQGQPHVGQQPVEVEHLVGVVARRLEAGLHGAAPGCIRYPRSPRRPGPRGAPRRPCRRPRRRRPPRRPARSVGVRAAARGKAPQRAGVRRHRSSCRHRLRTRPAAEALGVSSGGASGERRWASSSSSRVGWVTAQAAVSTGPSFLTRAR